MKNLNLLNLVGREESYEETRKGLHSLESIVSRFSLVSLICVFMLTLGVGNVWGEMYIEYYSTSAELGDDIDLYLEITGSYITNYDEPITLTLKNSSPGWTLNNGSCWMDITLSGSEVPTYVAFADNDGSKYGGSMSYTWSNQYGQQALKLYFYFDAAGDYSETLTISQKNYAYGTEQQSGTFTINFHVTKDCEQLAAPTNAVVTDENKDGTHGKTRVAWDRVTNNSGYVVNFYKNGVFQNTVNKDANKEYVNATFAVGTWTWTVAAKGDGSTYCETGNPTTDGEEFCVGADLTALTPSGLNVDATAADAVQVNWNALSGAGKYYLTFTNVSTSASTSTNTTNTYKNVSTVPLNKEFRVDLYAKNACLDSYSSLTASTTFTLHNVTFNMQGHGSAISAVGAVEGDKISAPSAPTATGYTFGGWYKEAGCTNAWVFGTDVVNEDLTLYAKWTLKSCSITFDKNSGTGGSDGTTATYGQAMTTITPPTRVGYTFGGYYDSETSNNGTGTKYYNADGTSARNWDKDVTATQTLYANWSVNTYTVQWKVNGVLYTTGTPSSSVNHGEHVSTLPTAPNPATYCSGADVFVGWTTAADGTYVHGTSPLFTTAAGAPTATGDQVFHAVFADYDD